MVRGISHWKKKYVEVIALHDCNGKAIPLTILWEDGRHFEIDEVKDVRQATSLKVGGNGVRYLIRVGRSETFLYYEGPRWFVEEIVTEEDVCS